MSNGLAAHVPVEVKWTIPAGAPGGPSSRIMWGDMQLNTHDTMILSAMQDMTAGASYYVMEIPWDWVTGAIHLEDGEPVERGPEAGEEKEIDA